MKTIDIFRTIMLKKGGISKPFFKFLTQLLWVFLFGKGRNNFLNMARWSAMGEKTFRRNYQKTFDFIGFNQLFLDTYYPDENFIIVLDGSYIRKSGKKSYGLAKFWSGCSQKALPGLEISVLGLVGLDSKVCFSLDTSQTPADLGVENRVDFYCQQLARNQTYLLKKSKHLVADGFYAKDKFLQETQKLGLEVISKLRVDANLRYLYTGAQKKRGRKKVLGNKINWKNAEEIAQNFVYEGTTAEGDKMYSQMVWSGQWKRKIKVVYLQKAQSKSYALLFSTDLELSASKIRAYYQLRFQIEFLFRDAKQELGLEDCQSIKKECLNFHFNVVMMSLNLIRQESYSQGKKVFSLYDIKTTYFNEKYLENIINNLGLDLNAIKLHPNYQKIVQQGMRVA